MQNLHTTESQNQINFNIKEEIEKYLKHWKWFLLGLFLAILSAFLYLRYTIASYKAVATILVKDDRKGNMASELSAFSDLGLMSNIKSNVDNEIEVVKSRTLVESTIKELELNISYLTQGRVKWEELYKKSPVKIILSESSAKYLSQNHFYRVEKATNSTFTIYDESDLKLGVFKYGEYFKIGKEKFMILVNKPEYVKINYNIGIQVNPIGQITESFKNRLSVATISKNTSVIELSIIDPVKEKAEDFLNALVENYNKDAIEDKKYISENTSKFIEQRLSIISDELQDVEKNKEVFKKTNKITDVVSEASLYLENASDFERMQVENSTQLRVVETMINYVNSSDTEELIPVNIITQDQGASGLISEYNQLVLQKNKLLKTAGSKNTLVQNLDNKINALKSSVSSSLNQVKSSLLIKKNDLARQNAILSGKISQIPSQERSSRDIDRKQNIKESLYLYLLQKREETAISLAVTAPNAKVIDAAKAAKSPVSPNRRMIYLGALLLGVLIPFGILYLIDLFDTKIKSRVDLERNTTIPFLGEIPKLETGQLIIDSTSRTSTAEAIRIVRTNLEFLLTNVPEEEAKVIFLTSTYPKEGKTFISVNLASTIALSEKRVLLVGLDIRNPRLDEYLKLESRGVTNYLSSKESNGLQKYITKVEGFSNLNVLPAGIIPPNPAELLMSKKVGDMFAELKKEFDYIIVDTAPVSLVTDTLLIAKYADAFIYVTRANFLDKRMLELPERLYNEKKLPNMSILINDTEIKTGYGYGYGYGYGQTVEKKPWYSFLNVFKR
ncbi:polysaccharide biosynthesis tyrosine autokinase [Flavobacterium jejuense]|uniref:non-specific protein-tyrosine kinase n=1 Tax=Flavobacterium jejuense TaxID=1544455 RepID=A0ABX0IWJ9_9FLAO|nr:tyrosine-protein kinase [Flavobacterium jejuense]NHN26160.1 polysaccharide biosynthesis tyrosine autokinase [Flavobacterium jejuense]